MPKPLEPTTLEFQIDVQFQINEQLEISFEIHQGKKRKYLWEFYHYKALLKTLYSLRSLDLSFNAIEHLDSTMFANTPRLLSLMLGNNRLTILPDNIFIGLNRLIFLKGDQDQPQVNIQKSRHTLPRNKLLCQLFGGLRQQ